MTTFLTRAQIVQGTGFDRDAKFVSATDYSRMFQTASDLAEILAEMFQDPACPAVTCREAESMGRSMVGLGFPEVALAVVYSHAGHESEDEGDAHYEWTEEQAQALVDRWVAGDLDATAYEDEEV